MIICANCGDTEGPWIMTKKRQFLCENCFDKYKKAKTPTKKRRKHETDTIRNTGCTSRI